MQKVLLTAIAVGLFFNAAAMLKPRSAPAERDYSPTLCSIDYHLSWIADYLRSIDERLPNAQQPPDYLRRAVPNVDDDGKPLKLPASGCGQYAQFRPFAFRH